eukprot:36957-Rhodomonas_salina.2
MRYLSTAALRYLTTIVIRYLSTAAIRYLSTARQPGDFRQSSAKSNQSRRIPGTNCTEKAVFRLRFGVLG